MRHLIVFCAAAFLFAGVQHACTASGSSVFRTLTWSLSMDETGQITRIESRSDELESIHAAMEKEVLGWKFQPGTIDGKPVPTDTALHVRVELVPQGSRYRVRIANAFTGVGYGKRKKPSWPGGEAARGNRAHLVVLLIAYDENGNVTSMEDVEQPKKVKDTFRNSARAAVSQWTFQPEIVGGIARAGRACVPVCFSGGAACPPARYPASAGSKDSSDGLVAIEPATRLLSDVAGRAL